VRDRSAYVNLDLEENRSIRGVAGSLVSMMIKYAVVPMGMLKEAGDSDFSFMSRNILSCEALLSKSCNPPQT
jgi:hypothetical protein